MKQSETLIQEALQRHIKSNLKGDVWKVHGSGLQRVGEPDLCGEVPIKPYGWAHLKIEVKTPTGEPTPIQLYRLRKYWERGYLVGIVTSIDDLDALIRAYCKWLESGLLTLPRNWICILREEGIEDTYDIYEGDDTPCEPLS